MVSLFFEIKVRLIKLSMFLDTIAHALTAQPSISAQIDDGYRVPLESNIGGDTFRCSVPCNYAPRYSPREMTNNPQPIEKYFRVKRMMRLWLGVWVFRKPGHFSWDIGRLSMSIYIFKVQQGPAHDIFVLENFIEAVHLNLTQRFLYDTDDDSCDPGYRLPTHPDESYSVIAHGGLNWVHATVKHKDNHDWLEEVNIPLNAAYYLCISFQHRLNPDQEEAAGLYAQAGGLLAQQIMDSLSLQRIQERPDLKPS